jgi:hypothetical protein
MVVISGIGSYITQYVGATGGDLWSYPAPDHTYYFAPAAFAIASLVVYGLTVEVLAPFWRRHLPELARWVHLVPPAWLILGSWPLEVIVRLRSRASAGTPPPSAASGHPSRCGGAPGALIAARDGSPGIAGPGGGIVRGCGE